MARPTTSTRPVWARRARGVHDGQDGEAAEGDEQQDRPVDVGEEASRQHADGGSALEGGAHEADVEAAAFGVGDAGGQDHVAEAEAW